MYKICCSKHACLLTFQLGTLGTSLEISVDLKSSGMHQDPSLNCSAS